MMRAERGRLPATSHLQYGWRPPQWEPQSKRAAGAERAGERQVSAQKTGEATRDSQPQAGPAGPSRMRTLHLPERGEHVLQVCQVDADTGVVYIERHPVGLGARGQNDLSAISEAHGILEQVDQDLHDLHRVTHERRSGVGRTDTEREMLPGGKGRNDGRRPFDNRGKFRGLTLHRLATGFQAREREYLFNERQRDAASSP